MKASGCWVLVLVCLVGILQTVSTEHGDDHEEGGDRGRKCGRALAQIDLGDTGMVVTENAITMRRLKEKNCGLAVGLECGLPEKAKGKTEDGMQKPDKMGGKDDRDSAEGWNSTGKGEHEGGGQMGKDKDMRREQEKLGSTRGDGTKICKRFGKLTEFFIAAIERLNNVNDNMVVENSTTAIIHSQDSLDVPASPGTDIPYSHSESDPDTKIQSTYTTVTMSAPGRQENTTCKGRLHIYISAGNGNTDVDSATTSIKKGDVKCDLEVTDVDNWFCNADGNGCASHLKIKVCLKVQRNKELKFNKKGGKICKGDQNKTCGQRVENDDGSKMDVINKCRLDGKVETVDVSIDENDCIDIIVKRFTKSLYMDPIMSASNTEEDLGDEASNVGKLVSSSLSLLVLVVLAILLTH